MLWGAGLVATSRVGGGVVHALTPLGEALSAPEHLLTAR
jgi:hypothetical protein